MDGDMSGDDLKSYQTQYTTLTRSIASRDQTMPENPDSGEGTLQRDSTMKRHFYPNPTYGQDWNIDLEGTTDSFKLRELKSDKMVV